MNDQHLTDDQLQGFLDGDMAEIETIRAHLKSCPHCREALADYKALYSNLETDPDFSLPADFAESVLAGIPESKVETDTESDKRYAIRDSVFVFAAFAAVIAGVIYLFEPGKILKWFTGAANMSGLTDIKLFATIQDYLSAINVAPMTVIFTILTIAAIAVIDHIIVHRKRQQETVSIVI